MQNNTWWSFWLHNLLLTPKHKNVSMSANTHQLHYLEKAEHTFITGSTDTSKCWLHATVGLTKLNCSMVVRHQYCKNAADRPLLIQSKGQSLSHQRWGCWTREKTASSTEKTNTQINNRSSFNCFPAYPVQALFLPANNALKKVGAKQTHSTGKAPECYCGVTAVTAKPYQRRKNRSKIKRSELLYHAGRLLSFLLTVTTHITHEE